MSPDTIVPNPVNPQSFNRYSYVFNNPLKNVDPTGHITIAIGIYGQAGLGGQVEGSAWLVFDDKGNWGYMYSPGFGSFLGMQANAGVSIQITSADTIMDLEGPTIQTGGSKAFTRISGPVMGSIGMEYVTGYNKEEGKIAYHGVNINLSAGVGLPYEQHITIGNTTVDRQQENPPIFPVRYGPPGIPIYAYVSLDYDTVEHVVNSLGISDVNGFLDSISPNPFYGDPYYAPYIAEYMASSS